MSVKLLFLLFLLPFLLSGQVVTPNVPYTGATQDVDLNVRKIKTTDGSTPAAPSIGTTWWYSKSGALCSLSSTGVESCAGASSGGGGGEGPAGTYKIDGCGIEYVSALTVNIGQCRYKISGVEYNSVITAKTLGVADATFAREDLIGVDNTGVVFVTPGTPAATPVQPSVDPATQLGIAYVTIPANATVPGNFVATDIYQENAEWTTAVTANVNAASTVNPYRGTLDIRFTSAVLGNSVTLTKPAAGTVDLSTQNYIPFYIRSSGAWPTGSSGSSALRVLNIFCLNGATQVGTAVALRDGVFGFSSTITTGYQQVNVPVSLFGTGSNPITSIKFQVAGNSGSSTISFHLDSITLQQTSGVIAIPSLSENQKIRTVGATFGSFESGATALTAAATACVSTYFSGTIQAVELIGSPSGNVTIEVKTVANASWTGIGSVASISAAAIPALSGATRYTNTTLTGWNKAVTGGTTFCFVMTAPATLSGATIAVKVLAN
jgi:hypothetical protein